MDNSTPAPIKPRLLELVAAGEERRLVFIAQLTAAQRAAVGTPERWAAKDHIAHITAWQQDAVRLLNAGARGETPAPSPEDAEFNPQTFTAQQHSSWDTILADAATAAEALRTAIEGCSEDDLSDVTRFAWRKYPLWAEGHVCGSEHPAEHFAQFYVEAEEIERAIAVRQDALETSRRLIGETEAYGYMAYNTSCFFALNGRPDLALAALPKALTLVPRLREWSQQDPDLRMLYDNPAFQALVSA